MSLSPAFHERAREIIARYPHPRSALLMLLHEAQDEVGYVSSDVITQIAALLGLSAADVAGVVSFYTMFKRRPAGRHLVSLCTNVGCVMFGGDETADVLRAEIGPEGEVTGDGMLSWEQVECLATCHRAPAAQVNYRDVPYLTVDRAKRLCDDIRAGRPLDEVLASLDDATSFEQAACVRKGADVPETPHVIFRRRALPESWTLRAYLDSDGYAALRKAVTSMTPKEVIDVVDASGLRGRGGAGFATGRKWSFIPADSPKPRYVVCNGDEGEPGAFHDREMMEVDPHALIEGIAIASYAIGARRSFIYCRGEFRLAHARLEAALAEAYADGYLGERVAGSDFSLDIVLHRGAGGYICGEETALLESLEGYRGMPRSRPPFPAIEGLYASPTVVNNVQTLMAVPPIVANGAEWFRQWGTRSSPGTAVVSVSGAVRRPANFEVPMGTTVRELIQLAGGVDERGMKAFCPGGSSTPMLVEEHLDMPMDYESVAAAGSALGATAIIVVPTTTCIVRAVWRWMRFYEHESCGKCTPCREGTFWLYQVLGRIEHGEGRGEDLRLLESVTTNMVGKTLCALADFAGGPVTSSLKYFRDEYEAHITQKRCPFERQTAGATT